MPWVSFGSRLTAFGVYVPTRSIPGICNALLRLAEQGTVKMETVGRVLQFRLNRNHLAAPAIIALAQLQQAFIDRLAHEIRGCEE
jgi:hypothetical protein